MREPPWFAARSTSPQLQPAIEESIFFLIYVGIVVFHIYRHSCCSYPINHYYFSSKMFSCYTLLSGYRYRPRGVSEASSAGTEASPPEQSRKSQFCPCTIIQAVRACLDHSNFFNVKWTCAAGHHSFRWREQLTARPGCGHPGSQLRPPPRLLVTAGFPGRAALRLGTRETACRPT